MRINRKLNIEWLKKRRIQHKQYVKETQERVREFAGYIDSQTWTTTSEEKIKELVNFFIR